MPGNKTNTSRRKKEHIELCLTDKVAFKEKTTGFEYYDFTHYAATEVDMNLIDLSREFFNKTINYPFMISCMTGGTLEAEDINSRLAEAAAVLKIPIGVGSQRQALENKEFHKSYEVIRRHAPSVPVFGNIGAAQIVQFANADPLKYLIDLIRADVMVVHLNPLQELIQKEGETNFSGLASKIERFAGQLETPIFIKEVGAGISYEAAKTMLNCGVKGIDTAGAGGTSWAGVEILRNKESDDNSYFWDWGLPTSYCIRKAAELKKEFDFVLIGSGGINTALNSAKALAMGADLTASARVILQQLDKYGVEGVIKLVEEWAVFLKKIMYLTGSNSLESFKENKLLLKEELH